MDELIKIIKTLITNQIHDGKKVVPDGFVLAPFMMQSGLNGDGSEQETIGDYQLDIFYEQKSELIAKEKALRSLLSESYAIGAFTNTFESTVALWRGTITIEILEV